MGANWTRDATLPGGEIANADYVAFAERLRRSYPWMPRELIHHYGRLYGARTAQIVGDATSLDGLGRRFGGQFYEAEVRYLVANEWALTAEDVLTRRTKHGLNLSEAEAAAFTTWFGAEMALAA